MPNRACQGVLLLMLLATAACQEPTVVPTPERPVESLFPIDGAFAFTRSNVIYARNRYQWAATLLWYRAGKPERVVELSAGSFQEPALSPDGSGMVVRVVDNLDFDDLGVILYSSGDLYLLNVSDASTMRQLTQTGSSRSPDWSPDGGRIVFVSGSPAQSHIYVMAATGGIATRLTAEPGTYATPRWSPDGQRLAFADSRAGVSDIFVMNSDGTGRTNVTQDDWIDASPGWSPDGATIAYSSAHGTRVSQLFTVGADGRNMRQLTTQAGAVEEPVWSQSGDRIALSLTFFEADGYSPDVGSGIYLINRDGTQLRQVTGAPRWGLDRHPSWRR